MRSTDSRHRTGALVERVRQSTLMAAYNARAGLRSWGMWGKPIASVHCVGISVGISSIYLREFHLKNNGDQFTSSHQLKSTDVRRHPWIFFIFLSQPFGYRYLQSDSSIIRSSEDNQYANDSHSRMVFPIGKFSYGNHS